MKNNKVKDLVTYKNSLFKYKLHKTANKKIIW